jgi:hypothetical protein
MSPRKTTDGKDDAVSKHLVRVTQEPGIVREVDDAELTDLARQGLLFSYDHTDEASAVLDGTVKTPSKWKAPARDDERVEAPPATTDPAAPATDTKGA